MYIIPEPVFGCPIQTIPRLNQAHQIESWNEEKSHKNSLLREAPNQIDITPENFLCMLLCLDMLLMQKVSSN